MANIPEEALLALAVKNKGGGGGTSNYEDLENKPQIAGTTLSGNKSLADLGIASASALANKVDKVDGKGLSTNDYTNEDKAIVGGVTAALADKVDKVDGKGLSSNDFTDAYKTAIGANTTAISGIKNGEEINSFGGVESALALKQNATDNSLDTDAKTIVGAINEHEGDISSLKSGLTTSNNNVKDIIGWNMQKNMLQLTIDQLKVANASQGGSWSGNTYTFKGVSYEVSLDVHGLVSAITINGTPTAGSSSNMRLLNASANLPTGNKICSLGAAEAGGDNSYIIVTYNSSWGSSNKVYDTREISDNIAKVAINISDGYTATDLVLHPMIRWAYITDATYEPYHPVIGVSVEDLMIKVPDAPTTDGTYNLQVTVASGVPTYSWVSGS